jgi:endonuclease-3
MTTRAGITEILNLTNRAYGRPGPFRRTDPVDEIVRTILSQNTNDTNSLAAFAVLKRNFKTWEGLLNAPTNKIAALIKHAGLANIKAARIKEALIEIKRREGKVSLANLTRLDAGSALEYLRSIKGVGPKTAACVLLFSFGKPVMPVDTHIFRVTKRLGLIGPKVGIEEAHELLTALVPKDLTPRRGQSQCKRPCSGSSRDCQARDLIYEFHLGIIEHGRKTCRALHPRCGACVLYGLCRFRDKSKFKGSQIDKKSDR